MKKLLFILLFISSLCSAQTYKITPQLELKTVPVGVNSDSIITVNAGGLIRKMPRSGITVPDATTTVKGKIKLAGDLAGTADLPTVPGLATKVTANSPVTAGTYTKLTVDSKGLFTSGTSLIASDVPNILESQVTGLVSDLALKADKIGTNILNAGTKKYYALGNSITHGYGTTSGNTSYADLINAEVGFLAYQKFATLGCTVVPTSGRPEISTQVGFIPSDANIITVMIGVNDYIVNNPVGEVNAVLAKTFATLDKTLSFAEAFRFNLETIKINRPNAKVYVITPTRVANSITGTYPLKDYVEAEVAICNYLSIPVIDAYNNSGIYYNSSVIPDGLHPNDAGQLLLKDLVLRNLISPNQESYSNKFTNIFSAYNETTGVNKNISTNVDGKSLYLTGLASNGNNDVNNGIVFSLTNSTSANRHLLISNTDSPIGIHLNKSNLNAFNGTTKLYENLNISSGMKQTTIGFPNANGLVTVNNQNGVNSDKVLVVRGSAGQTGVLLELLGTAGTSVFSVGPTGIPTIVTAPTTSAGTYDFLSRNQSTGFFEKIPSANVQGTITATTAADYYAGDKTMKPLNAAVTGSVLTGFSAGSGTVASTDTVLQGFNKLAGNQALKANLAGTQTFTGVNNFPTAANGTNTDQVATTAFVQDALITSSTDIQDIVDAPTKTALIDGGNSQITMFDGSADNRTYSGIISNGAGNSSDFNFQNSNCFIRNEVSGGNTATLRASSGLIYIAQTTAGVGSTEIGVDSALTSTTWSTPAFSVAGSYKYESQPKEYLVSALPTPTGSDTRFAIVTDALAPSYMVTIVGGGSVVCPVFFDGVSWKAH